MAESLQLFKISASYPYKFELEMGNFIFLLQFQGSKVFTKFTNFFGRAYTRIFVKLATHRSTGILQFQKKTIRPTYMYL